MNPMGMGGIAEAPVRVLISCSSLSLADLCYLPVTHITFSPIFCRA